MTDKILKVGTFFSGIGSPEKALEKLKKNESYQYKVEWSATRLYQKLTMQLIQMQLRNVQFQFELKSKNNLFMQKKLMY